MQIINIKKKQIEKKINITIKKNEQLLIYGMNGSGKTMIINEITKKNMIEKKNTEIWDIGKKKLKEIINYAYQLGIEEKIKNKINTLSSGQKKKYYFISLLTKKKKNVIIRWTRKFYR